MTESTPDGFVRVEGVLVRRDDGRLLRDDFELHGNVYIAATAERVNGEIVYTRLDPDSVMPA